MEQAVTEIKVPRINLAASEKRKLKQAANEMLKKHTKITQVFFKIEGLKNFVIFIGKHLRWSLFLD